MTPALLVLAAGTGSRYGGLKQVDPVGPAGETLLDYAVYDALRAGFGRIVFVVRPEIEGVFRRQVGDKYAGRAEVDYVFQAPEALPPGFRPPPGRAKPWGTGHAVWCARGAMRENFGAINADDFYGADSFAQMASFLASPEAAAPAEGPGPTPCALVGFRLADTLSEHGSVARGLCACENGRLLGLAEKTGLTLSSVGPGKAFSGGEIVSMNCWAFTPGIFGPLDRRLGEFCAARGTDLEAEFYLSDAVGALMARGEAEVRVLPGRSSWFGITYREDRPRVAAAIAALTRRGQYPARLFPR